MPTGLGGEVLWLCPSLAADNIDLSPVGHIPTLGGGLASIADTSHGGTRAYSFSAASSKNITIPHHSSFNFGTGDFTLSAWLYFNDTASREVFTKALSSGAYTGFILRKNSATQLDFGPYPGTSVTAGHAAGVWNHVSAIRNSGECFVLINGIPVMAYTIAINSTNIDTTVDLLIGGNNPGWGGTYFDGKMDDIRIFGRAITPLENGQLASQPGFQPSSGGGSTRRHAPFSGGISG